MKKVWRKIILEKGSSLIGDWGGYRVVHSSYVNTDGEFREIVIPLFSLDDDNEVVSQTSSSIVSDIDEVAIDRYKESIEKCIDSEAFFYEFRFENLVGLLGIENELKIF